MITARRSSTSARRAGVGVEVGDVAGQLPGDVGDHGDGVGEVLGQQDQRRGRRSRRAPAAAMARAAVASCGQVVPAEVAGHVADERHPRLVGRGAQRVGVAEPLGLGVEGVVLAGLGRDGLDLLESVPEHVGGLGQLARLAAAAVEVGGRAPASRWWAAR